MNKIVLNYWIQQHCINSETTSQHTHIDIKSHGISVHNIFKNIDYIIAGATNNAM